MVVVMVVMVVEEEVMVVMVVMVVMMLWSLWSECANALLVRTGAVATRANAAIIATTPIIVVVRVFNSLPY